MDRSERESHACSTSRAIKSDQRNIRIRELNDDFRRQLIGGRVTITSGIEALGLLAVTEILDAVRRFHQFGADNDPHGEHDFGAVTYREQPIFWKIDCYDTRLEYGSPDPTNPTATTRVITIMLACEY